MHKRLYSRFLESLGTRLHFAAHSHHPWPDVSREAHLRYWDDSARWMDEKWEHFFSNLIPECSKILALQLSLKHPENIAFAPNTHELLFRLLSTFELDRPVRILTTHNEFHSFRRQIQRLEEAGWLQVTRLQADLLSTDRISFLESIKKELNKGTTDLLFMSQVFFDSGLALSLEEIESCIEDCPDTTRICIDGYHAFAALPVDLSRLESRIFYLAGGYKYAQAGEGFCFMTIPKGEWRPLHTGWFAEIDTLSATKSDSVKYAKNGSAFWGSTQDFSAFYRFHAVWKAFANQGIQIGEIHRKVKKNQNLFLQNLDQTLLAGFKLINADQDRRGHFLAFDLGGEEKCRTVFEELKRKGVLTDYRGQRLRIGFGLYQDETDILELISRIRSN